MSKAYFLSDIHLGSMQERNANTLVRFLRSLDGSDATHLFLVGDIFDLWIGRHAYFVDKFADIVKAIDAMRKSGIEVCYFEGNHDLYLHTFWQRQLAVEVFEDAHYFDLGGRVVRVEHGDLINPDDRGYLFLRWFLRTPFMKGVVRVLPGRVVAGIGEKASRTSRKHSSTTRAIDEEAIRRMIREHARRAFRERPFDVIITGHVHVRDEWSWDEGGRTIQSINLGSWYDAPAALCMDTATCSWLSL